MSAEGVTKRINHILKLPPTPEELLEIEIRECRSVIMALLNRLGGEVTLTHSEIMAIAMSNPEFGAWRDDMNGSLHLRLLREIPA